MNSTELQKLRIVRSSSWEKIAKVFSFWYNSKQAHYLSCSASQSVHNTESCNCLYYVESFYAPSEAEAPIQSAHVQKKSAKFSREHFLETSLERAVRAFCQQNCIAHICNKRFHSLWCWRLSFLHAAVMFCWPRTSVEWLVLAWDNWKRGLCGISIFKCWRRAHSARLSLHHRGERTNLARGFLQMACEGRVKFLMTFPDGRAGKNMTDCFIHWFSTDLFDSLIDSE